MNILTAKNIQITDYLGGCEHKPVYIKNQNAWFYCPFRKENTPSFKVDLLKNLWYDFGEGIGGNTLDLIMKINNIGIPGALAILKQMNIKPLSITLDIGKSVRPSGNIKILHIQELRNKALVNYISSRMISVDIAKKYLQEAYYSINDIRFFAIAFQNDKGGYELRNEKFKGGSSPKYFTTLPGQDPDRLNIFEGVFDFLSFLTYYKRSEVRITTIILNSLAFIEMIIPALNTYKKINLFLDNDQAGKGAAEKIRNISSNIINYSSVIYPENKDFNEFLINTNHCPLEK